MLWWDCEHTTQSLQLYNIIKQKNSMRYMKHVFSQYLHVTALNWFPLEIVALFYVRGAFVESELSVFILQTNADIWLLLKHAPDKCTYNLYTKICPVCKALCFGLKKTLRSWLFNSSICAQTVCKNRVLNVRKRIDF